MPFLPADTFKASVELFEGCSSAMAEGTGGKGSSAAEMVPGQNRDSRGKTTDSMIRPIGTIGVSCSLFDQDHAGSESLDEIIFHCKGPCITIAHEYAQSRTCEHITKQSRSATRVVMTQHTHRRTSYSVNMPIVISRSDFNATQSGPEIFRI